MINEPVKANELDVEIFTITESNDDLEEFQLAVNGWLKNQPDNIFVHDVIYRHSGRTPKGKDILSVVILSGPIRK